MTRNENLLFVRHFETVQKFYIFFWNNMVMICVYTYSVKITETYIVVVACTFKVDVV